MAQCESRAHRIGQTSAVKCHYLLARGTVDDYMWNMVKTKQDVLNKAGIFSEDLGDATHSTISVSVSLFTSKFSYKLNKNWFKYFQQKQTDKKLTSFFETQDKKSKNDQDQIDNNGNNHHMEDKTEQLDYHQLLNDDDDDDVMLALDI